MSYIKLKKLTKKNMIKTLKKIGDDILVVKTEVIYAFPRGMLEQQEELIKRNIGNYSHYRLCNFVKKFKEIKYARKK